MPRLENTGPIVNDWYEKIAERCGTSTWDVCKSCARQLDGEPIVNLRYDEDCYELIRHGPRKDFPDLSLFKFEPYGGGPNMTGNAPSRKSIDEPDGVLCDGGCEHPLYGDEDYDCAYCGDRLRDYDN